MMHAALGALAAGAVAGIFLATRHFLRKRLPVWVALLHGLGGATGFACVLWVVVSEPAYALARQALYLLIATIALGCVNLLFHVRRVRHRTSLIVMHALCAVSGVSTIAYAIFLAEPDASGAAVRPVAASAHAAASPAVLRSALPPAVAPVPAVPGGEGALPKEDDPGSQPGAGSSAELALEPAVRQALAESVLFETNGADLDDASLAVVARVATVLKAHPEIALIQVQGHADERGSDTRNVALTRERAAAVVDLLEAQGIVRERLRGAGFGARCPANPSCRTSNPPPECGTPESMRGDRRVVFVPLRVGATSFRGALACDRGVGLIPLADAQFHVRAAGAAR
jgi:outer membrane protein OmpA-like peptidoglycan-associated protein